MNDFWERQFDRARWREGVHRDGNLTVERLAIRSPVWHSKEVGIAAFRAHRADYIEVKVLYKMKETDKSLLPKLLRIPSAEVLKYPMQIVGRCQLHLVPIADMKEV